MTSDPNSWSTEQRQEMYDAQYFNGGGKVGGYAREGYWDYPVHWTTFNEIAKRNPESVLEIGAARGYILKRFEDIGLRVAGLEVSNHCVQTRVIENIMQWDITKTPWPIADKAYDLVVSMATLEHIPADKIPIIAREIDRVSRRGLHGIDLGEQDDGFDKTHCTFRPVEWWRSNLPLSNEIVNKEDLERGPLMIPQGDNKLKLNLGSFTTMFHHGWTNIDIIPLQNWAKHHHYIFRQHDLRTGLPYDDNRADLMYSSHCLEHMTYAEGQHLLNDCHRVLKPGGVLRLSVPDAGLLISSYNQDTLNKFNDINPECKASNSKIGKLWSLLVPGHSAAYDIDTLTNIARNSGFEVAIVPFRRSSSPQILRETLDLLPSISIFAELYKQK